MTTSKKCACYSVHYTKVVNKFYVIMHAECSMLNPTNIHLSVICHNDPPWYSGSEGSHAPAGKSVDPFQAD